MKAPAKNDKKNLFFEDGLEEIIEKQIEVVEEVRAKYDELYLKRYDKSLN